MSNNVFQHVWIPLSATPLLWLAVTLGAYVFGLVIQKWFSGSALASPVLISIAVVSAIVLLTRTTYQSYFAGAQFINFLLGPATIALAVPLAKNIDLVRHNLHSIGIALIAGSLTSIISGVLIVWVLGGTKDVALSMAPKSVTTPIAMAVSIEIGGVPALTAALAILGGILAAILGQEMLHRLNIRDWRAHGLAAGVAGSGVAAAQVAARNELGAAFAAVGIGLNGLLTAIIVPLMFLFWK
ncbi:LrgB family protein [Mesorhizobium sp. B2-4-15]|uniref:LrgB family protein n=1 Tax=Mesorhizobium sp. B2-4-15 TaxID=2589934 RepID=UPI001153AD05|nr:LrgB family protein [Mesorhizobium sp. B2-4-15]TPK67517.1 LrgB family protein [Mesorhizobium sp. B2-4-15]